MSRVAKATICIPKNVEINIQKQLIFVKGKMGILKYNIHRAVQVQHIKNSLLFSVYNGFVDGWAQAGTARSIIHSIIIGVTQGFFKKLQLIGVGYRVMVNDNIVILSLGFSHTIKYKLPTGITAESTSNTELLLKGANKQLLNQIAANIRSYRRPEPYKGKGVKFDNEVIRTKEAKKK